ncbi:helix-turn-helix domain-containing protein [Sphingobacterium suaedae]|uniref:Helix-turn-helix domain-containing protein n=1 Tax=Sphingobacterium suaedae TaxID=1686402 RepID=A0ABW5KHU1_9SPHI
MGSTIAMLLSISLEIPYLSGVVIGSFLSVVLFTKAEKKTTDYMLACWLVVSTIMLLSIYLLTSGLYLQYPVLSIQGLWMPLAQGPFLYLYIKYQTRPIPFQKNDLLHFVPFFLGYLVFSQFYWLSFSDKVNVLKNGAMGFEIENKWRIVFIYLSGLIYIPLAFYRLFIFRKGLKYRFSNIEKINFRWLLYLVVGMAAIWAIVLIFHKDNLVFSASVVYVWWMGYFGIKQVNVFSQKHIEEEGFVEKAEIGGEQQKPETSSYTVKYAKSLLEPDAANRIYLKLQVVLNQEKPYLNPELTLNDLARMVDTHPNLLSQVINSVIEKNFYELINELRVNEFLERVALPANKKYTLLTIAYDCGFNSKASFNRNFKKHTGKSPQQYLNTGL